MLDYTKGRKKRAKSRKIAMIHALERLTSIWELLIIELLEISVCLSCENVRTVFNYKFLGGNT